MDDQEAPITVSWWERFVVRKIWGWIFIFISMIYNLLGVGKIFETNPGSIIWGIFFLAVSGIFLVSEAILLAGYEEKATQVGSTTTAIMIWTALWWILVTPPIKIGL